MIKTRHEKEEFIKSFEKELKDTKNFCLACYQGLTVKELEDLRKKLKSVDASFSVIRNRLVLRVIKSLALSGLDEHLKGPTAIILEKGDPVKIIKQLSTFSKTNDKFKLKAAYLDNNFLSGSDITRIASLPSKEQLIAQVVGGVSSPLRGLMNVLNGPMKNLVVVLSAASSKK